MARGGVSVLGHRKEDSFEKQPTKGKEVVLVVLLLVLFAEFSMVTATAVNLMGKPLKFETLFSGPLISDPVSRNLKPNQITIGSCISALAQAEPGNLLEHL